MVLCGLSQNRSLIGLLIGYTVKISQKKGQMVKIIKKFNKTKRMNISNCKLNSLISASYFFASHQADAYDSLVSHYVDIDIGFYVSF